MRVVPWLRGAAALLAAAEARAVPAVPPAPCSLERPGILAAVAERPRIVAAGRGIRFRADRMELGPELRRLRLEGHVVVWVDRYRLSSEWLKLRVHGSALDVEGPAMVAFCPCPSPPLSFGFTRARVESGDVVLTNPTLRAFGVPVMWAPVLWFRSPSHVGLLPFEIAYRGSDGLLLGSGVHVPLGSNGLDVAAAGYVRGGTDVRLRLATARTNSSVRWDYLRGSALALDLRGAASEGRNAAVAWDVDALRGGRALTGPSLLEQVALRQDRAHAAAGWLDAGTTVGVGVVAAAPRGAALTEGSASGPELYAGFGAPIGTSGTARASLGVETLALSGAAAVTLAEHRGELLIEGSAGPLALELAGRTRAVATVDESRAGYTAAGALSAEVSAPLVKDVGTLEHWVTPFVSGLAGAADRRAPSLVLPITADGGFFVAAGGLRSTLGERAGARAAGSISARAGYAGDGRSHGRPLAAWVAAGQGPWFGLRGEGAHSWGGGGSGSVVLSTARVGPEDGLFVEGRVEGAAGDVPLLVRVLATGFDAPWVPWLDGNGWSVGGSVGIPWTRAFGSVAAADYDATRGVLLGLRGAVTYRHSCGCLSVTAWAGHRRERKGADALVAVSLAP